MAVNCSVRPIASDGSVDVRAIDTRAAGVTISVVKPSTPLSVAVIAVPPVARAVVRPLVEMDATGAFEEAHVTDLVMS